MASIRAVSRGEPFAGETTTILIANRYGSYDESIAYAAAFVLVLASVLACPVFTMACLHEGHGYRVSFAPFAERIVLPRGSRDAAIAAQASSRQDGSVYGIRPKAASGMPTTL